MKIVDCWHIENMTVFKLSQEPPFGGWKRIVIDGITYEPHLAMDAGRDILAIDGKMDLTGKEVSFIQ